MPGNVFARTGCTLDHWYAKDSEGNHYFASATDKGWYPLLSKPAGYSRISYAKNQIITTEDFEGLDYDETIYMYAYWEPNSGILGDVNMSGSITVADATYIQKYVAGIILEFTDDNQYILADVNFDGNITTADATMIQKYVGGQIDEFGT